MTDNSQLADDTWATVDINNNREPRKLTVVSPESTTSAKSTTEHLTVNQEGNAQCMDMVGLESNPGDFYANVEEPQEKFEERLSTENFMEGNAIPTKSLLPVPVPMSNNNLTQEGMDTLENNKTAKSSSNKATKIAKPKEKSGLQKINENAATSSSAALILPKSVAIKPNTQNFGGGRGNSKSPGGPKPLPALIESQQSKRDVSADSQRRGRSRSSSRRKHCVEVHTRKGFGLVTQDESPYACNIVELPLKHKSKSNARKVLVSSREHSLLKDQISTGKKHPIPEKPQLPNLVLEEEATSSTIELWLTDNPSGSDFQNSEPEQSADSPTTLMSAAVPLKSWPTFSNLHGHFLKAKETQTCNGVEFQETGLQVNLSDLALPVSASMIAINLKSNCSQTDVDSMGFQSLEKLANKLEQGVFSASEACTVLIHTIFRESIGNASAADTVLNSVEFQEFLNSPNEMQALENVSVLLRSTSRTIDDYITTIKNTGITFPDYTNFAEKSDRALSIASVKGSSNQPLVKQKSEAHVWYFVSPDLLENFQLSLYYNPDTGDILQTIKCQDSVFRTRYTTTVDETHQLRNILSASREQVGIPAFANYTRLMDTIVRCSSFASTRLTAAKSWISKCYKELAEISVKFSKTKYQVSDTKDDNLKSLAERLRKLNVFAGIIHEMSSEMVIAFTKMQSAIWKTMYVQDVLKFPRIPGFPNPNSNEDCQIPCGTHVPVHEAMIQLTEAVRMIDNIYNLGQYLSSSVESGVKSKCQYKRVMHEYLEGIKALGKIKDVDYGTLLMTLLCSTQMINHYEAEMTETEPLVRTSIITHLSKISGGTNELKTLLSRMEQESLLLTVQTMGRLKEVKKRQKSIVKKQGCWSCMAGN